jgi:small GTP-binding protein
MNTLRVGILGGVDAGKSTLISVLKHDILDDGRGTARIKVMKHPHEIESGRTSSIGFNYIKDADIESKKVLILHDLAGHEKYLKTTIHGLCVNNLDLTCILIGANMGINKMTKEHLGLTISLKIPYIVVITKVDLCPENVLENTLSDLERICKTHVVGNKKLTIMNSDTIDYMYNVKDYDIDKIFPVILISNTTGKNISILKKFLFHKIAGHPGGHPVPPDPLRPDVTTTDGDINSTNYFVNGGVNDISNSDDIGFNDFINTDNILTGGENNLLQARPKIPGNANANTNTTDQLIAGSVVSVQPSFAEPAHVQPAIGGVNGGLSDVKVINIDISRNSGFKSKLINADCSAEVLLLERTLSCNSLRVFKSNVAKFLANSYKSNLAAPAKNDSITESFLSVKSFCNSFLAIKFKTEGWSTIIENDIEPLLLVSLYV